MSVDVDDREKMVERGNWGVRVQGSGGRLLCFRSILYSEMFDCFFLIILLNVLLGLL